MDSTDVRRRWASRSGEYSPAYYAYYGANDASETIRETLTRHVGTDAAVLELGCSSGRHLAALHEHGFDDLAGIDLNEEAFAVMRETYPDLAAAASLYHGSIEEIVGTFDDGAFDAVYSVETLQHVHPDSTWVFEEIARIADHLLVTIENEGHGGEAGGDEPTGSGCEVSYVNDEIPLYHRDWNRIFTQFGFDEVASSRGERDTVRTFRRRSPRSPT
ncbi:MAG: class I SAM-dependent methyltransferase [Haloferacaceae archaeon]